MDWMVISPEYGTMIPVLDDGSGPMEYGCDVVCIRTDLGKGEAIRAAVLLWTKGLEPCGYWEAGCGENPFAGVTAEPYAGLDDETDDEWWEWT